MREPERAAVAVARVDFHLVTSRSLKDKRSVVTSFLRRARERFGLAACESGYLETPTLASLTLAAVSSREGLARDALRSAVGFLEECYEVEVIRVEEEPL